MTVFTRVITHSILAILSLAATTCSPLTGGDENAPEFDGVTASFNLTRFRIKTDEKLEVHCVFRNRGNKTTTFRFYEPSVDASLFARGKDLGILCETAEVPFRSAVLKPGDTYEFTEELYITRCYHLAPGRYSIRFNYSLGLIFDESLRSYYEEKYRHPFAGIVPWDARDHYFTVVRYSKWLF